MPEMVAPRALVFRPLVKGNEALGTRLATNWNLAPKFRACADVIQLCHFEQGFRSQAIFPLNWVSENFELSLKHVGSQARVGVL